MSETTYIIQAKVVHAQTLTVKATNLKDAHKKFIAGEAELYEDCILYAKIIGMEPEQ